MEYFSIDKPEVGDDSRASNKLTSSHTIAACTPQISFDFHTWRSVMSFTGVSLYVHLMCTCKYIKRLFDSTSTSSGAAQAMLREDPYVGNGLPDSYWYEDVANELYDRHQIDGTQRANAKRLIEVVREGIPVIGGIAVCLPPKLFCIFLSETLNINAKWLETDILEGWKWFQQKVIRRMSKAQFERWYISLNRSSAKTLNVEVSTSNTKKRRWVEGNDLIGAEAAQIAIHTILDWEELFSHFSSNIFKDSVSPTIELPSRFQVSAQRVATKMETVQFGLLRESMLKEMELRSRLHAEMMACDSEVYLLSKGITDQYEVEIKLLSLPVFSDTALRRSHTFLNNAGLSPLTQSNEGGYTKGREVIELDMQNIKFLQNIVRTFEEYEEWVNVIFNWFPYLGEANDGDYSMMEGKHHCDDPSSNIVKASTYIFRDLFLMDTRLFHSICSDVYTLIQYLEDRLRTKTYDPQAAASPNSKNTMPSIELGMELFHKLTDMIIQMEGVGNCLLPYRREHFKLFLKTPLKLSKKRLSQYWGDDIQ